MRCTPMIERSSVLLPQPLGPSSPATVPAGRLVETPSSTTRPPRRTRSPSTAIAVAAVAVVVSLAAGKELIVR